MNKPTPAFLAALDKGLADLCDNLRHAEYAAYVKSLTVQGLLDERDLMDDNGDADALVLINAELMARWASSQARAKAESRK